MLNTRVREKLMNVGWKPQLLCLVSRHFDSAHWQV
jgi:hypothetical protein